MRIGLLGGSFNPAHEGHLHLSLEALKRLDLDQVWWLVSPQNPLKSNKEMADYDQRFASAEAMTKQYPRIRVSRFEQQAGTRYTVNTLLRLKARYPQLCFIWLMGADNLAQMHRWRRWRKIFQEVPIAVFDRAPYSRAALQSPVALAMRSAQTPPKRLIHKNAPAWSYLHIPRHAASATALRNLLGKAAFLGHN